MALVTTYCPLLTTGTVELVCQTAPAPKFEVDSRLKPDALVAHDKTTFEPACWMFRIPSDSHAANFIIIGRIGQPSGSAPV